jgi:Uma2 family endonuclease
MIATTSTPALFLVWSDQSEAIDLTLLQGLWTEEQYLKLTDATNCMIEFTDGAIEVLPMPTDQHQSISQFIFLALRAFMQHIGGKVHYAPLRLQIRPDKFREPDILLVRDAHDPRRQNRYWLGADLVVEIVSPDNPERDTVTKRADYAAAGIPEYWIVNPEAETVMVLTLAGDSYADQGSFGRGTQATSALLAGFAVDVDALFDAE